MTSAEAAPAFSMTYGVLERTLAGLADASPDAIRVRFRKLRLRPFPDDIQSGTGNRIRYDLRRVLAIAAAFELNRLYVPQGQAAQLVEAAWPEWCRAAIAAAVELGLASRPGAMPSGMGPVLTLRPNAFGGDERFAVDARSTVEVEAPLSAPSIRVDMRRVLAALVDAEDSDASVRLGTSMRELDATFGWSDQVLPEFATLSSMPLGETFLDEGPYFERARVLLSHADQPFDRAGCPAEAARLEALVSYLRRPAPLDAWKAEIGDRADDFRLKHLLSAWASRLGLAIGGDQPQTFHSGLGNGAGDRARAILEKVAAAGRLRG